MSLVERSSVGGGNFWGLTQQKGPWRTTPADVRNAKASMKQKSTIGGGVGNGGTLHAGHGNYSVTMTPADRDAWKSPPPPSQYATRSVMMPHAYMKKPVAGGVSVLSPTAMTLGVMKPDDVGKAGMHGYIPPMGGYPEYEGGATSEELAAYYEDTDADMIMSPTPSSFGMTEHRMEEMKQEPEVVGPKDIKEEGQAEALFVKPSGAARMPIPKVRLHPGTRGVGKKQKQPQDAIKDRGNIIQLLYPISTTPKIPTYKPPVYDQVMQTEKASLKKKKPSPPGSPLIGKKHALRFKEGPDFSKFPKTMMSGPATELVPKGEKRKAETQAEGMKKGKTDYKRKAEEQTTEKAKKGRVTGPRDAAMKAKIKMAEVVKPKKKVSKKK